MSSPIHLSDFRTELLVLSPILLLLLCAIITSIRDDTLPEPLVSIYQQYKKDTNSVASRLASTAKACGYPASLLSSGSWDVQAKGNKAGKGRKGRKQQAAGGGKYIVALADFRPLANFIARSSKLRPVSVPDSFVTTIDRLIALRASFRTHLAKHGAEPAADADARHSHFVGVLEAVRDALRPRMSTPPPRFDGADDGRANRFSILPVYEPSEAFLKAPAIERPQPVPDDKTVYEAEQQASLQESLFAMSMMMDDLCRIRSVISWIWSNYGSDEFDLAACAVATNTATELAHGIIEDVVPVFRRHGGTKMVLNKYFQACCLASGLTVDQFDMDRFDDSGFDRDVYRIADRVYLVTYRLVKGFLDKLGPRELPLAQEGFFGKYSAARDAATETDQQLTDEDTTLLMEFFTELMVVIRLIPNYPVEDELVRGMREMDQARQVPFHLVFAAQIYLDIHHTLRAKAASGGMRMVVEATMMHSELDKHLEFHQDLKMATLPVESDHMVGELHNVLVSVLRDPVYEAKVRVMPVAVTMRRHRILQHSPVLAGLTLFQLRICTYKVGMSVANTWRSIQSAYHLYHALQTCGLLRGTWTDMEVAHSLLGDSAFFVGDPPRSFDDSLKKFCLQVGVTAAAVADARQPGGWLHGGGVRTMVSRAGPRGFRVDRRLPVSSMFAERYLGESAQMSWTRQQLDDILARSEWEVEEGVDDQSATEYLMKQVDGAAKGRGKGQAKAPTSSSTVLSQCWRLLRDVRGACDAVLRALYTPAYIEREAELSFVVGYAFMAACDTPAADLRLLRYVAEAFNGWLGTGEPTVSLELLRKMGHHVKFVEDETSDGKKENRTRRSRVKRL
ncbi:uncharacterized protein B0T15DRAFT_489798 [Chaetomium strumarium]|uniref:DUF6604 domain-containing protein n=1 Tax=Chaetomium strumarium TaxID=1170767 RepID=A0AAJ0H3Q7_9PEZI|nr:hypothetical protein B0T15DRAFT_489798 [Chaetomium strumarium]